MSSLVDYEDSEDEGEEAASAPVKTASCKQDQGEVSSQSQVFTSQPGFRPDQTASGQDGDLRTTSSHSLLQSCSSCETTGTSEDLHTENTLLKGQEAPLPAAFAVSHTSTRPKRPSFSGSGIRPYIPKRQRLTAPAETVDPQHPAGHGSRRPSVLEVSDRLKPYLGEKASAAGTPGRLMLRLEGHQGPVNTLQWCPVPQFSHLLLSASMDKTFKVWDGAESGRSLRVYTCHTGAVRDACWTPCGRRVLTGSFDSTAVVTDVETGQPAVTVDTSFRVMCVAVVPGRPDVFLCGGYSPAVQAWDTRCCKVVKVYSAGVQQTLDLLFLRGGSEFVSSSDCVSRDSADRTLMVWDFQTAARLSNQIFHERYTCPSLALHPLEDCFVAQTNGDYVALFSTQRPYRMNKRRRFEGHKVEGYAVRCSFSPDGGVLASGSSSGCAHFYDFHTAGALRTLQAHSRPCLSVSQHALLPAAVATGDWAGEIKVWN
ncbi:WD repeat-containing protein 25 [Salarias fasciatus]|uniref:Uncharacterized protein n=1 Tax=Salarias fasciatus TaxID=181472 RepID=A0A672HF12_SALFA|nr:WD repeat-containing protein 25 [Salarias fasciatus]XP_029972912.1 WD repeat-containing protein 25 [Salarias fasciatus]XP_029972914.1 WD repeat-containing protein 25 [Salarias fasciatus]XP_029972915.1 WD repeat-containing protein 25 [Salarias fasciatus]